MEPLSITLTGSYVRNEIPPRCRKPRPVSHGTTAMVSVPRVEAADAPVAMRVRDLDDEVADIRTWDGRLFCRGRRKCIDTGELPAPGVGSFAPAVRVEDGHFNRWHFDRADSPKSFQTLADDLYSQHVVIGDEIWTETAEPGYLVTTFGIGGFNGSTGLMVSSRTDHGMLFRADEFDAARDYALQVAKKRGDDYSRYEGASAETYRAIDVLIDDAVRLVTVPVTPEHIVELRIDYDRARSRFSDAQSVDDEAAALAEVLRLRKAIIAAGYAPIDPDVRPYEDRKQSKNIIVAGYFR